MCLLRGTNCTFIFILSLQRVNTYGHQNQLTKRTYKFSLLIVLSVILSGEVGLHEVNFEKYLNYMSGSCPSHSQKQDQIEKQKPYLQHLVSTSTHLTHFTKCSAVGSHNFLFVAFTDVPWKKAANMFVSHGTGQDQTLNYKWIHQPTNALNKIQFVTNINLLHVSTLGCHPQGVFQVKVRVPTHQSYSFDYKGSLRMLPRWGNM
jgi:hypothetical protein